MSDLFSSFSIADSGLDENRAWLDAISDNISNMNDATSVSNPAFQARFIEAQAVGGQSGPPIPGSSASSASLAAADSQIGQGVEVTGVALGDSQGTIVSDPSSPLANAQGLVRMPDVDLGQQMTQMMMAQTGYEANLATVSRATQAYQAALELQT